MAQGWSYSVRFVPEGQGSYLDFRVWDEGGGLLCDTDNLGYCDHIQAVINEVLDAQAVAVESLVIVPLVRVGREMLFVPVSLQEIPGSEAKRILITHPDVSRTTSIQTSIGLLSPEDGRLGIINVLAGWATTMLMEVREVVCKAGTHGFDEQRRLAGDMAESESSKKIGHVISLVINECCMYCLPYLSGSSDVPDDPNVGSRPWIKPPKPASGMTFTSSTGATRSASADMTSVFTGPMRTPS